MGDHNQTQPYIPPGGVTRDDRLRHALVVGKDSLTTAVLSTFALEDLLDGNGVVWVAADNSARALLDFVPPDRVNDVTFFSPGSPEDRPRPFAWNLMKNTLPDARYEVAEAITAAFGSIYREFWGPQSAFLLRTAVAANLDLGNTTLLACLTMLSNSAYRAMIRPRIKDPVVLGWWEEFERWPEQQQRAATAPLQNKLGALLTCWPLRNILGQVQSKLDVGRALAGSILIVELKPQHLGSKEMVRLFGSLLLYDLIRAGRHSTGEAVPGCFVYLNDCALFAPDVVADLVAGADAPLSVALATSHLDRLEKGLERTLLAASGAVLASRSSYADAQTFYKHFGSLGMKEREFASLRWNELAVKLETGEPYWSELQRFPEEQFARFGKAGSIIRRSQDRYGTPRSRVERDIRAWHRQWTGEKP